MRFIATPSTARELRQANAHDFLREGEVVLTSDDPQCPARQTGLRIAAFRRYGLLQCFSDRTNGPMPVKAVKVDTDLLSLTIAVWMLA
jgi:hypothetical protein